MHHVAIQRSDIPKATFMTEISMYDLAMLIWLNETAIRKYGYSICKLLQCDHRLLARGIRYTAVPVISIEGVHDVYLHQGNMNGDSFSCFVEKCLLLILIPFSCQIPGQL